MIEEPVISRVALQGEQVSDARSPHLGQIADSMEDENVKTLVHGAATNFRRIA
jgi:hypothetical protein